MFQDDPTARGVVRKLLSVYDVTLSPEKVSALEQVVAKEMDGVLTAQNARKVAARASRLIFGTPEFQFC
jgi:hypothetical protein